METLNIIDELLKNNSGVVRTGDAIRAGLSRTSLCNLVKVGKIERVAHGKYIRPDDLPDDLYLLQQCSAKIIFSHETALFLHNMTERTPLVHTFTIPSDCRISRTSSRGCKIYYVKPEYHGLGKCTAVSQMGNELCTYDIERTICDILRSRNRIDNQIIAASMKNYAARKNPDWNKLREYGKAFRVEKLLLQYLEVLV